MVSVPLCQVTFVAANTVLSATEPVTAQGRLDYVYVNFGPSGMPRGRCYVSLIVLRQGNAVYSAFNGYAFNGNPGASCGFNLEPGDSIRLTAWGGSNMAVGERVWAIVGMSAYDEHKDTLDGFYEAPFSGPGELVGAHPTFAAGSDLTFTVPAFARWKWYAIRGSLVADAVGGNRSVKPLWTDQAGHQTANWGPTTQLVPTAASGTQFYCISTSGVTQGQAAALTAGQADLTIFEGPQAAGSTFQADTGNFDAGDQWISVSYMVEEWVGPSP